MTKYLHTLALMAVLAAAGCVKTPPTKPALSSTDRNERLKAVNAAEEKFGAQPRTDPSTTTTQK